LHGNNYAVRLLVGDTLNDNSVKADVLELLQRNHGIQKDEIINEPVSCTQDLISQIAATDIVVSARFHNILLALMLAKSALALQYHEKFTSLTAGVGLAEYCHDIDSLDVNRLTSQIAELADRADHLGPHIKTKVEVYRRALEEQYTRLFITSTESLSK